MFFLHQKLQPSITIRYAELSLKEGQGGEGMHRQNLESVVWWHLDLKTVVIFTQGIRPCGLPNITGFTSFELPTTTTVYSDAEAWWTDRQSAVHYVTSCPEVIILTTAKVILVIDSIAVTQDSADI